MQTGRVFIIFYLKNYTIFIIIMELALLKNIFGQKKIKSYLNPLNLVTKSSSCLRVNTRK